MVEKLLKMSLQEVKQLVDDDEYNLAKATASRLKKSDRGEWKFESTWSGFFVKRTK